jgi:flagellar biogenesis protein FliO
MNAFPAFFRRGVSLLTFAAVLCSMPVLATDTNTVEAGLSTNAVSLSTNLVGLNANTVASNTNAVSLNLPTSDIAGPLLRVFGALAIVIAVFLGGVWLFRNWQRFTIHRGHAPKLNVVESRSLGGRHAIYVVGYENERFLISSSPTGINMLTHLRSADETPVSPTPDRPAAPQSTFAQTLAQMLKGNRKPE